MMEKNQKLLIGQAIGIYALSGLPLIKISQRENTMLFNEKLYLVGRVLGADISDICTISEKAHNILVVTPVGFIISTERQYIQTEPSSKMRTFLQEHEALLMVQGYKPYGGRLEKVDHDSWFIPTTI